MTAPPFLERYDAAFTATWDDQTPIDQVRFVVLDSETTGLDSRTDRIITIGAVAVCATRSVATCTSVIANVGAGATTAVTVQAMAIGQVASCPGACGDGAWCAG